MKSKAAIKKELDATLRTVSLTTVCQIYPDSAQQARKDTWSYEQFLLEVVERECEARRCRRIERFLRESRLPLEKSMENFDLKRMPVGLRQQIKTLLDGSFIDRRENVLAFGNPGSGKTHLLCAIGQELIHQGRRVAFRTCSHLVQELLQAKRDLTLHAYLKRLSRMDALIIDDIGYVQQSREEMEVLFTLLADRYERGSVMLTSNLAFSNWEQIFKTP
mgnify:CR=1 FL=1